MRCLHFCGGVLIILWCAWAAVAQAESGFRCNGSLVTNGETVPEVLAACGEPAYVHRPGSIVLDLGGILFPIAVDEEWIYNLGPQQFIRFVRFYRGRVVDVSSGGYGWLEGQGRPD